MRIQFPTSSFPGTKPQESAGRLINAVAEPIGEGRALAYKLIRAPGARAFTNPGTVTPLTGFRGMANMRGTIYAAYKDKLVRFTEAAPTMVAVTPSVPLTLGGGVGPVFFAIDQNVTPNQILVPASGGGAYKFTSAGVDAAPITNVATAIDVTYGLGFFFYGMTDGRCFSSTLPNTPDAGPFTKAESKPDDLLRTVFFQDQLYLMGRQTVEIFGKPVNTGVNEFPLTKVTTVQRGLIGNKAVTAYEEGVDLGLCWVANNYQVVRLNGYLPERISTPDVERDIEATADKSKIECTSFLADTHIYLKIRAPEWCWVYDFTTQKWHERESYLSVTSRLLQAIYTGNRWLIGDADSNIIGEVLPKHYLEFGSALTWQVDAVPVQGFPNRVIVGPAHFNFVPGVGEILPTGDQTFNDPQLAISWSDDCGVRFTNPVFRPLGRQQQSAQLVSVYLTGSFGPHGRTWRLVVTDPVYVGLLDGDMPRIQKRMPA